MSGRNAYEAMWRAIRHAGGAFADFELAAMASTDARVVSRTAAARYARALCAAGYLRRVKGGGWVLRPSQVTGPRPPRPVRAVFDPNSSALIRAGAEG